MSTYHGPNGGVRRTYTPQQWQDAQAAWETGRFGSEWGPFRALAARAAGIIAAPNGTAADSWGDESPSQRAILIRAIRETPKALESAIRRAPRPTWEAVIEVLLRHRDVLAEDADDRAESWQAVKPRLTAEHTGAMLRMLADSVSR